MVLKNADNQAREGSETGKRQKTKNGIIHPHKPAYILSSLCPIPWLDDIHANLDFRWVPFFLFSHFFMFCYKKTKADPLPERLVESTFAVSILLPSQTQSFDQGPIPADILFLQIIQKTSAPSNKDEKAPS